MEFLDEQERYQGGVIPHDRFDPLVYWTQRLECAERARQYALDQLAKLTTGRVAHVEPSSSVFDGQDD